jgi:hypothetical protein
MVSGLDLKSDKLYMDLGFPLISPNLGKHYPTADYFRFSYEFYQLPNDEGLVEMDNPEEEETAEGRDFQDMCELIEEVNEDTAWRNSQKPIAQNPLFVSRIVYKKVNVHHQTDDNSGERRVLADESNTQFKYVPDYILTNNVEETETRFSLPFFAPFAK